MASRKVLLCAPINFAKSALADLEAKHAVHLIRATDRAGFLEELASAECAGAYVAYRPLDLMGKFGRFDDEVLNAFPASLKFIAHNGAGFDQIDIAAAKARGISVSNTPGVVNSATADTAVFLMLGALRNFNSGLASLRQGEFRKHFVMGSDPAGKTLGIVGMGGIGRAVAARVAPFGMKVVYHNRRRLPESEEGGASYVATLDELLACSDVISLNLPLNANTRHTISTAEFEKMKDGVVIVNTARGPVIDEKALVEALNSGKVAAAGLDVYEREPAIEQGLIENQNCILLPHVGTVSKETQTALEELALANVQAALEREELITPVPS